MVLQWCSSAILLLHQDENILLYHEHISRPESFLLFHASVASCVRFSQISAISTANALAVLTLVVVSSAHQQIEYRMAH
jgi:hypothetical protein